MGQKMSVNIPTPEAKRNKENLNRIIEINKKRQKILKREKKREIGKNT